MKLSDNIRQLFPIQDDYIYLNSGSLSMTPTEVLQAVTRYQKQVEINPTLALLRVSEQLWTTQKNLAGFFGAEAKDIFMRHNVTSILNEFILGAPLASGSEILYSDLEYGAIKNICRFRAEQDGLGLREFRAPRTVQGALDEIIAAFKPNTRMLLLSHVFTGTGQIMPIAEIAEEARRRGILLVVDGAHGPGALQIDFRQWNNLDFYAGNIHKWMMGPKGTAFGWVNPIRQDMLVPTQAHWNTFGMHPDYSAFGEGSPFQAKMSFGASFDFAPFLAINDLLQFWLNHGVGNILERLYAHQYTLETKINEQIGLTQISPSVLDRGPLLSYELPDKWASANGYELLWGLLKDAKLQVSTPILDGKRVLRLSPHIYNTEQEILDTVLRLKRYL